MTVKHFNGKAIYNPAGKAGEYAKWACNFYVGCSNGCEYCYCKKGILGAVMGQSEPQLKKCFRDEEHALDVFRRELVGNPDRLADLRQHGIFFSFTTDPMLDLTMDLTLFAVEECLKNDIPVKILTKNADNTEFCFLGGVLGPHEKALFLQKYAKEIAIGFTLTGHDELEPHASTNAERIEAMRKLHEAGFKTWASIEPLIYPHDFYDLVWKTCDFCDLYKVGLMSGGKYNKSKLFMVYSQAVMKFHYKKFYFKDSFLKAAGLTREELEGNCVGREYNLFNVK